MPATEKCTPDFPFLNRCLVNMHFDSLCCDSILQWNLATAWENLFMSYASNKGADQPAHPRSLISNFVVRCLDSIISLVSTSETSCLYLASVAAQAGLSLTWSKPQGLVFSWRGSIILMVKLTDLMRDSNMPYIGLMYSLSPNVIGWIG